MGFIDKNFNYIIVASIVFGVTYWLYDEYTKSRAVLNSTDGGGFNNRISYGPVRFE
jgi:hypothetical protein